MRAYQGLATRRFKIITGWRRQQRAVLVLRHYEALSDAAIAAAGAHPGRVPAVRPRDAS